MTNTTIPNSDVGIAHFEKLDNWLQNPRLLAGDDAEVFTYPYLIGAGQTLVEGQVVGFSGGFVVPAVLGTTAAVGVMTQGITTAGGETTTKAAIYRGGTFNMNALKFDATYDTDAKKLAAFEGAPTPTQITVRIRPTGAPGT